jgi:hypothetical protein
MVAVATKRRQLENNLFSSCGGKFFATSVALIESLQRMLQL